MATHAESVLSSRAMLAKFTVKAWSAKKTDRAITADTNARLHVTASAGRYNKNLVKEGALDVFATVASEAYAYHKCITSPWLDTGPRLLAVAGYPDYTAKMRDFRERAEDAARDIQARYPSIIADARTLLNGAFDLGDYPAQSEMAGLFGLEVRLLPVPDARDWRVDMSEDSAAILRADVEQATREAMQGTMRDAWERIAESVGHMAERLRAYKPATAKGEKNAGIFRDTLVTNVRDLVAVLPLLNISGDATLAGITARMERELCDHDADELRESARARTATAEAAEAILAQVSTFLA